MDTNSNIPPQKEIVSWEILHLDELGYGPGGLMTRKKWRAECLKYFILGRDAFNNWQNTWVNDEKDQLETVHFGVRLGYVLDSTDKDTYHRAGYRSRRKRCTLDFDGCVFDTFNIFSGYCFLESVSFTNATFKTNARFERVLFLGDARFDHAVFEKNVFFYKSKFCEDAWFDNTNFHQIAGFTKTNFNGLARFEWSQFHRSVDFENAVFENVGHFENVSFYTQFPIFRGCKIDTTRLEFSEDSYFPSSESSEDAIKNISFLKRLADEHGQTDQALNFNAMELRAKRSQTEPKAATCSFKVVTWLYDKMSNYGRSFTRPLLVYGVFMVATFVFALGNGLWTSLQACPSVAWDVYEQLYRDQATCPVVATVGEQKIPLTVPRAAFEYTAYRASGVLDFVDADKQTIAIANRLFNQPIEPMWMRIWGVFKAIASTALLFLAALGLRNKYRIK